jgi:hypothetical protein
MAARPRCRQGRRAPPRSVTEHISTTSSTEARIAGSHVHVDPTTPQLAFPNELQVRARDTFRGCARPDDSGDGCDEERAVEVAVVLLFERDIDDDEPVGVEQVADVFEQHDHDIVVQGGLFLAQANFALAIGKFSLDAVRRAVWFEEALLGEAFSDDELRCVISSLW